MFVSNYSSDLALRAYYRLKPVIPRRSQLWIRRKLLRLRLSHASQYWPIDEGAAQPPAGWVGWPQGKQAGLLLTHDVETQKGHQRCFDLAQLEREFGLRSLYNFVPERYDVSAELRRWLALNGFEIGVHGLNHDGNLYSSYEVFQRRAVRINQYLLEWEAVGFRSPAMHHNLAWLGELNISYDLSTFDSDPFEPQSDGVRTIFPFWVPRTHGRLPYLEMPYTLPQDHTLFIIMEEKNIDIWKRKLEWIVEKGGMILVNVHPDYMSFGGSRSREEYPVKYYVDLLEHINNTYRDQLWHGLPQDLFNYCEQEMRYDEYLPANHQTTTFPRSGQWVTT